MTEPAASPNDPFTAVLSELRAPIGSIQDHIRTLMSRDDELTGADRQLLLQQTLRHSQRLDSLVDDIVLYLRLVSGAVTLAAQPVRLFDAVEVLRERLGEPERVTTSYRAISC